MVRPIVFFYNQQSKTVHFCLNKLYTVTKRYRTSSNGSKHTLTSIDRQVRLEFLHNDQVPYALVTKCVLNRPKANAMGHTFVREMRECLDYIEESITNSDTGDNYSSNNVNINDTNDQNGNITDFDGTTRVVLFTSTVPRVFSAGADLKERASMTLNEAEAFVHSLRLTFQRISDLHVPTIACIDGVALGGGLELALATDIRVAGIPDTTSDSINDNVQLGLPETSLAIIPGAGGTQRLMQYIGVARAKDMIFTGRRISSQQAYEYGLVQHVSPKPLVKALELSWQVARNGPIAVQAAKQAIQKGSLAKDWLEALRIERECYAKVLPTDDRIEGLAAFRDKRTPAYKGK